MLPRSQRISRKIFSQIARSGKYFNSEHFSLRVTSSQDIRAAVSVSKKVSKKAVTRNKIRRRAYIAISQLIPDMKKGLYLVIAKVGSDKITGVTIKQELAELFKKV